MGALKYSCGQEIQVGDLFVSSLARGYRFIVTEVGDGWVDSRLENDRMVNRGVRPDCYTLVARAPSSPAPTPTEGDPRWQVGAYWEAINPGNTVSLLLLRPRRPGWDTYMRLHLKPCFNNEFDFERNVVTDGRWNYRGNIAVAVEQFLTALTDASKLGAIIDRAWDARKPAPLVDAEELAARQRAAHRAEAERLQERYAAFRASVTDVASEFPAVQVVTDTYRSKGDGTAGFVAWLSCGDLRHEFVVTEGESHWAAKNRARDVLSYFRAELGSRLLKGGGKG